MIDLLDQVCRWMLGIHEEEYDSPWDDLLLTYELNL